MLKVTFDSMVWRIVASPHQFPNNPSIAYFRKIHEAVKTGKTAAYIAEVAFTLEALKNDDRQPFMKSYEAKIDSAINDVPHQDGMIGLSFTIGPDVKAHPGNNPHLYKHLNDALSIGFKIIRCARVAQITNPDIDQSYFVQQSDDEIRERLNLCSECAEEIERLGGGIAHAMKIGSRYSTSSTPWRIGLKNAPPSEAQNIAKALAEWADGDAIAAHVGYKNDFFCTRDTGKSAGAASILSPQNRAILESKFGVKFISPEGLGDIIDS
ncbi:MAG: hypothetical protein WKF74_02915 [Pyrinomonadaceae bacterium]